MPRPLGWSAYTLVLLALALLAAGPHDAADQTQQRQIWAGDAHFPFVVAGCLPAVPGSGTTLPATACAGYGKVADGRLLYLAQEAATVALTSGAGTYWLALDTARNGDVSGWTREKKTAYLWQVAAAKPVAPPGGQLVAQVTLAGGNITAVADLRTSNPSGQTTFNVKDPLWGCKGDAAADDTACWQAIANRVSGTASGGTVVVPDGIYLHTATINFGTTTGVRFTGMSYPWITTTTTNRSLLKWAGAPGSPMWWFKQGSFGNTFEYLGFSGADEAIRFRRQGGSLDVLKDMTVRHCAFDGQAVTSLMIGYPLADTTSDDDMDGYLIEQSFFGPNAQTGIIANVKDNGYRLTIRDSVFTTVLSAIETQGFHDISLTQNNITHQTKDRYGIRIFSGNGYFTVNGLYTERGRVLFNDTWGAWSATRGIVLQNIVVNSNDSLVDAAAPHLSTAFFTTYINVNVSTGTIARHIANTANGCVVIGTGVASTADVYDGIDGCLFLGFGVSGTGMVKTVQSSGGKGVQVLRRSDTSPTGEAFSVRRNDDASTVASLNADGTVAGVNVNATGRVTAATGFIPGAVAFAGLGSCGSTPLALFCNDCQVASTCTGSGGGAWAFCSASVWHCPF